MNEIKWTQTLCHQHDNNQYEQLVKFIVVKNKPALILSWYNIY